jgi:hypothetical protein
VTAPHPPPSEYTQTCPPDHQAGIGAISDGGVNSDWADWRAYCSCGWSLTGCASRGDAEAEHARHVVLAYRGRGLEPPPGFERFEG